MNGEHASDASAGAGGDRHAVGGSDLVGAVLEAATRRPELPALTLGRRTLSYGVLASRIRSTAAALRGEGFADGDRVLFSVRPGPDAVVLALGIVLARGTVVFADPGAGEALFRSRARLAAPRWVAAESVLYLASSRPLRRVARRRGLELAPYATLVPEARHVRAGRWLPGVPRGALPLERLAGAAATAPELEDGPRLDDDALVVFTSGTTDLPKGVVHSRGSLGAGLGDFADHVGLRAGQRVLTDQLMVGVPALIAGAHWTMPPTGANPGARPEQYLDLLGDAQLLFAVPAAMDAMLRALDERPALAPAGLETIVLGGAPVLRPLLERIFARFPDVAVRAVYGMTEILPVAVADGREKLAAPSGEGGDPVGRLMPSVTARLDDGELVLAGPGLARGYLHELPGRPLTELRTGDLARLDAAETEGRRAEGTRSEVASTWSADAAPTLTLLGRAKDMFIHGTQNVYPGLYEPVVAGIDGVAEAVVSGVPDEIGDDRIVLVVVPADAAPSGFDAGHPLVDRVRRALPGLIDAGAMPQLVLAAGELPRAGRSRKLDRRALADALAVHLAAAPAPGSRR